MKAFQSELLFTGREWIPKGIILVEGDEIKEVRKTLPSGFPRQNLVSLTNRLVIPGGVNSHSHAFQILIRGKADQAQNFRDWVDRYLYPLVLWADEEALYAGALLAFGEMIQNGITTVGEFYYIHNEKDSFRPLGNRLDEIAIQAATDIGLRICLLRTLYTSDKKEGQKRFSESLRDCEENSRALFEKYKDHPLVSVLPAPHSLHGASEEAIQLGARLAEEWDGKFHIHLAEEKHDLVYSQEVYQTTPLRALEKMGVLNDRLVIVHGCHLDPEEIAMLGSAGGGLAYNPISNMALGDGISPIEEYIRQGVRISLGTDGACANNQENLFAEAKAAEHLQRVSQLRMNVIPKAYQEQNKPYGLFQMATLHGGENLCLPVGLLEGGYKADFIALNLDDLSLLPDFSMDGQTLLNNVIFSMSVRSAITDSVVGGEFVLRNGRLVRMPEKEIVQRVRNIVSKWNLE
ncbi:MAG: hypothetical protein D6785_13040 [Planctomycetota bacterium]|nr:MAG: hypothetical protein D6785_13040 [Planctomycetota bacterium]